MKRPAFLLFFCTVLLITPFPGSTQDKTNQERKLLNFFFDCEDCDLTFVRQKLPFVSFVRDPKLADVHVLVSDSHTGSGGRKYFMHFIGIGSRAEQNFELEFLSNPSDTEDDLRKGLLKIFKVGMLSVMARTGSLDNLKLDIQEVNDAKADEMTTDPWKKWVFRLESGGEFQKEKSQNEYSLRTQIRGDKITNAWKTRMEASYELNRENYYDDGERFTNKQHEQQINANFIRSLNSRWSLGLFGEYSADTYMNISNSFSFDGAVEYNFFDWDESNRRVFSLSWAAGLRTFDYSEETIYSRMNEKLAFEAARIKLELVQPWGTVETSLEGRHFFNDFSKYRITLDSEFAIRLTKQLSVYSEIQSEIIHDQLYLPKGDASVEDVLLKRRKLATTYEISGEMGIRFTFGSVYNNVVNERF